MTFNILQLKAAKIKVYTLAISCFYRSHFGSSLDFFLYKDFADFDHFLSHVKPYECNVFGASKMRRFEVKWKALKLK